MKLGASANGFSKEPAAPLGQPVQLQITPEDASAASQVAQICVYSFLCWAGRPMCIAVLKEPAAPSDQPAKLETPEDSSSRQQW